MATTATATGKNIPSTNATGATLADFETHAGRIRDDIEKLAGSVATAGSVLSADVRADAGAKAHELREASENTLRELRSQLGGIEKQLRSKVRERPVAALGVAVGIGFLIALIARR